MVCEPILVQVPPAKVGAVDDVEVYTAPTG